MRTPKKTFLPIQIIKGRQNGEVGDVSLADSSASRKLIANFD